MTIHNQAYYRHNSRSFALITLLMLALVTPGAAIAEQMQSFGEWEVHYIVLPTTFLQPDIAQKYEIVRGNDRALMNVSLVHKTNGPSTARVQGEYKNLLSQNTKLDFVEVNEGDAIYYLAQIKHTDRDFLRFTLKVTTKDDQVLSLDFDQTMYANP